MNEETNKELVRRFVDAFWNEGDLAAADELVSPDVVIHQPIAGSFDDLKAFSAHFRSAFPDWHSTVEEMIAEGDRVAERWTGRGTHKGELQGLAPTGKSVAVPGVVFYRISDGRIVEFRGQMDQLSLLTQLGVMPPAAAP